MASSLSPILLCAEFNLSAEPSREGYSAEGSRDFGSPEWSLGLNLSLNDLYS